MKKKKTLFARKQKRKALNTDESSHKAIVSIPALNSPKELETVTELETVNLIQRIKETIKMLRVTRVSLRKRLRFTSVTNTTQIIICLIVMDKNLWDIIGIETYHYA